MKTTDIQIELRNYKLRQGYLYKRSRIMRQWRKRWIVLTMNFLFSFQNEKCQKPTQIIDLKQVLSLKTLLKKHEDSFDNCFVVQTKTIDFAIAAKETSEKWSWIVTFQRLFDFKERGASSYNNIDLIKKEGFQSQEQFEYKRKNNSKNDLVMSKTKNFEQQCRKKEEKADQILQHLIEQQQKLNAKQEKLLLLENKLQKQKMLLNEKKQLSQANAAKDLVKSEKPKEKSSLRLKETELKQKQQHFQKSENKSFGRSKWMQYIFEEFETIDNRENLSIILEFLLKIAENQPSQFRKMLFSQTQNHSCLKNFINYLVSYAQTLKNPTSAEIKRFLTFFALILSESSRLQAQIKDQVLQIICNWISSFDTSTQLQVLMQSVNVLLLLAKLDKIKNREKLIQKLQYLAQLSTDLQYRKFCQQGFLLLNN